jgi:hypothetical protein
MKKTPAGFGLRAFVVLHGIYEGKKQIFLLLGQGTPF